MKAKTDDMHVIFLLKKNVKSNIIKTILEYPSIAILETLKKQKMAIILVRQGHKYTESRHNYRTGLEITYGEREIPIDIRKFKNNYEKNMKPRYFNCNIQQRIAKSQKKRRRLENTTNMTKQNTQQRTIEQQKIKNKSVQEDSDNEDNDKEECFVRGSEQIQYDKLLHIINPLIDMLFLSKEIISKRNSIYTQISRYQIERNYG